MRPTRCILSQESAIFETVEIILLVALGDIQYLDRQGGEEDVCRREYASLVSPSIIQIWRHLHSLSSRITPNLLLNLCPAIKLKARIK